MQTKSSQTKEELLIKISNLESKISELEKSKLQSSIWLENSPVCTKIIDLDFNLQYMSRSGIRDLKINDITEFYGKPYPLAFYPDSFKIPMTKNLKRAKETGETVTQEASIQDIEGNTLWYKSTITPVYDDREQLEHLMVVSVETTAGKLVEDALKQSEATIRNKLKAITEPEGDIGNLELSDIIDTEALQTMMDDFYRLTGMLGAVLDVSGKVLVAVGWSDICTKFHRCNAATLKNCIESDTILTSGVPTGTFKAYHCKNNMWDIVTPIMVGGKHVGNVFMGQYFLEDEEPDYEFFRKQARKYGFNEKEYLAALDRAPRFSKETVNSGMQFYSKLAEVISKLSFSTIQQSRILAEQKQIELDLIKAKNKAEENQKLYEDLVQSSHNLIWKCDLEGKYTFLNSAWENTHGYKVEEMLGRPFSDFQSPEVFEHDVIEFTKHLEGGFVKGYETTHIRKDGTEIPLIFNALPLSNSFGEIIGTQGTAFDISKLKQTELEIIKAKENAEESEKKYRDLINLAQEGIWVIDKNSITNFANPSMAKMLGYSPEEMIGKSLFHFMDEKGVELANENLERRKAGSKEQHDFEFICKNNDRIFCTMATAPIIDTTGNYQGAIAGVIDITKRKQSEEETKKNQSLLRQAEEISNQGAWEWDIAQDEWTFSENWLRIHGCQLSGINRKELMTIAFTEDAPEIEKAFQDALKGVAPYNIEHRIVRQNDGKVRYVKAIGDFIFNDSGQRVKMYGVTQDITDKKHTEDKIRAAEENLKNTFDLSPSIICKANLNTGFFVEVNRAVTRILGYTIEEFISKPLIEFIHPEDRQKTVDVISTQMSGNEVTFFENRYLCKDDSYKWMAWNSTKADNNGMVTAIASDISERKIAEQTYKESEVKYRTMIETSNDMIWTMDSNGNFIFMNKQAEKASGYSLNDLIGKSFEPIVIPDELPFLKDVFAKTMNGETVTYEMRLKTFFNTILILSVNTAPIYSDEKISGMFSFARDISEQKKAEHDIRKLSTAVKQSPLIVVITDTEGIVEYVNPKFTELTGYSSNEVLGQKSNILKSGEQDSAFYLEMWEILESGKVWRGQFHNRKKNGELFWEAASISAILNESGNVVNYIKIGEDITQQKIIDVEFKIALEKALESDRLKSAFLANMSHEIRTPMNGIIGFVNLLNEPNLSKSQIGEYSSIINKSGDRLLNTINDIIDISKVEAGEVIVSTSETSVNNEIEELYSFFLPEAKRKGLSLFVEPSLSAEPLIILTDNNKLHGILTNLIKNAIKYSERGSITFGYFLKNNFIEFYVKDTGIGIPKNRLKAIFNRFEQADISDKLVFEGSGLGLAISKAYVEMLGGEISVISDEGKGSKFVFTIPCIRIIENEVEDLIENFETDGNRIQKLNLLIVEDDEVSSELLKIALEGIFKEIIVVENGKDAVETCRDNPELDLVLMDIKIPIINGYDATKEIRKFNKDLLIIAQTAYAMYGDKEKAIEAGCDDYISKPIDKILLIEMIDKLFN